ncbi:hypothetical protein FRC19_000730 [Serendipita sp. 401]|nr:hypothetical protein FRC19_000730 [Serendipita sp. 401]
MRGHVLLLCRNVKSSRPLKSLTSKSRKHFTTPITHFSTSRVAFTARRLGNSDKSDSEDALDVIHQYLSDEHTTEDPSVSVMHRGLADGNVLRAPNVLKGIANSYLRLSETYRDLGVSILDADTKANALTREQISVMYNRLLKSEMDLAEVNIDTLVYVSHILASSGSTEPAVLESLINELLRRWSDDPGVGTEEHFRGIWTVFSLLRALLRLDFQDSIPHFQNMLKSRSWWPTGSMDIPDSISEPPIIILVFILRCCMSWRWWERAYLVAAELLGRIDNSIEASKPLCRIFQEVIDAHIAATGVEFDARLAASLLCAMADHPALPPVSDHLLFRFYTAASVQTKPNVEIISSVYLYLRDKALVFDAETEHLSNVDSSSKDNDIPRPAMKKPHAYLPPRGRTMHLLMEHYQQTSNQNAARLIVQDTQKKLEFLPTASLPAYLKFLAKMSFATEARQVVEHCAASKDLSLLEIGRIPGVARPLVSLFVSSADAAYLRSLKTKDSKEAEATSQQSLELLALARRVVVRYRKTSTSLDRWSHQNLTTLMRMAFEVGYFGVGFRTLDVIRTHHEILPDDHDFHVLLHTLATGDSRAAYELLEYMISRDVEPTEVMYSAIAAQAIKQGDFELAQMIVPKAQSRGRQPVNSRLLGAICWHTISPQNLKDRNRREIEGKLRHILQLLGPVSRRGTIFRERTFGIRAAHTALRIDNPELAFAFWKRCIRYKSIVRQPDDPVLTLEQDSERGLRMKILTGLKATNSPSFLKGAADVLLDPPRVKPVTIKRSRNILPEPVHRK